MWHLFPSSSAGGLFLRFCWEETGRGGCRDTRLSSVPWLMDSTWPKGAGEGHGPGEGSARGTSYLWWCLWWFWLLPVESPSGGRLGSSHLPCWLWSGVWESIRGAGDLAVVGANFNWEILAHGNHQLLAPASGRGGCVKAGCAYSSGFNVATQLPLSRQGIH